MNQGTGPEHSDMNAQMANLHLDQYQQNHTFSYLNIMVPPEFFNKMMEMMGQISSLQDRSISEIDSLTKMSTFQAKLSSPQWDWDILRTRAGLIMKRSVTLMKKILNLRAKASIYLCMVERRNPDHSEEEYELIKRDILEVKHQMKDKLLLLKDSYIERLQLKMQIQSNHSPKCLQMKPHFNLSPFELQQILSSLQILAQECCSSRLELEMIEELHRCKPLK